MSEITWFLIGMAVANLLWVAVYLHDWRRNLHRDEDYSSIRRYQRDRARFERVFEEEQP